MLPKQQDDLINSFALVELPTNTPQINFQTNYMYGYIDGLEAMKQAVYLILNVERYQYLILSWNYGVELASLFGKPTTYVLPELKRRIVEALMQDKRITAVDQFEFETRKGQVHCRFRVQTKFGDFQAQKAVSY